MASAAASQGSFPFVAATTASPGGSFPFMAPATAPPDSFPFGALAGILVAAPMGLIFFFRPSRSVVQLRAVKRGVAAPAGGLPLMFWFKSRQL